MTSNGLSRFSAALHGLCARLIPGELVGTREERQARLLVVIVAIVVLTIPISMLLASDSSVFFVVIGLVSMLLLPVAIAVLHWTKSVQWAGTVYLVTSAFISLLSVAHRGFDTAAATYLIIPSVVGIVVIRPRWGALWGIGTCLVASVWAYLQHQGIGWQGVEGSVETVLQAILVGGLYILLVTAYSESTARRALASSESLNRELMRARDEANRLAELRARFLATMSHEIRTPLNGMVGAVTLMRETPLPGPLQEYVSTLEVSASSLLSIINDVLDLSKIEAGHLHLASQPTHVAELVDRALRLAKLQVRDKNVSVTAEVDVDVPRVIKTDAARLGQILANLLGNAVKFTEEGSIHLRVSAEGSMLRMAVQDTGVGIPADRLDRIFEPFRQADESHERRYGGTGLGLPISRRIAKMLGGDLVVRSVVGQGSTFIGTVALVPSDAEPENDTGLRRATCNASGLRVLVVDDHPINRKVAAAMLNKWGAETSIAVDGMDAVHQWTQTPTFHLVLMDWEMPLLNGGAATQKIRELPGGEEVPIVALTAHVVNDFRQTCLDAGLDDYLSKPLIQENLARVVEMSRQGRAAFGRHEQEPEVPMPLTG